MSSIAFINNYFPGLTATFIYLEVIGLRAKGISIKTFSIRKPKLKNISKESHTLYHSTKYILPLNVKYFLKAHCYYLLNNPLKYFKIIFFLVTRHFENRLKDRIRTLFHFYEGVYLAKIINDEGDITHIHAHYASHPTTLALVVHLLTDLTFSFTAHAYDIWTDKLFIKEKVDASKFVITCTKYGNEQILKLCGANEINKINVIYHGVDLNKFMPYNKVTNEKNVVLLNIGRLIKSKAHANFIEACKVLNDEKYNFQCLIIGDGPLYNELYSLIEKYRLQKHVRLIGKVFHDEIIDYYQKADIFVLPSISGENLPNVLLESLALRLPVIATNIAGIPELIKNRSTGLLIQPNITNDLVNAIKLLINDKELRLRLGENGRKYVCDNFNVENSLEKLKSLYIENGIMNG